MDDSTITTDTVIVNNGNGDIGGTVSYSDTTATFTPSANLDFNSIYTATITTVAMDLAGNAMASAYTWSFKTILALPTPTPTTIPTPVPTPSASPESKGTVFGTVYGLDEEPLKGVTVTITGTDFSDSTETDENGYYEFRNLASGDYTLTYEKEGYQIQTKDISLGEGEILDLGTIIMELIVKGKISGYVMDRKGNPIESVRLRLKGKKTKFSGRTSSDANGYFEFTNLRADTYVLTAKKKGYATYKQTIRLKKDKTKEFVLELKKLR